MQLFCSSGKLPQQGPSRYPCGAPALTAYARFAMKGWGKSGGWESGWDKGSWGGDAGWGKGGGGWGKGGKGKSYGKGKGGGSSKGKYPAEDPWQGTEAGGEGQGEWQGQSTSRILSRYQVPKAILRTSAADDGSCFVKEKKIKDDKFLDQEHFSKQMTVQSCHLNRRPGVGLSETVGSIAALKDVLSHLPIQQITAVQELFHAAGGDLDTTLGKLNTLKKETLDEKQYAAAFKHLHAFLVDNFDALEEGAIAGMISSGRMYLGFTALRQLLCVVKNPKWWAGSLPDEVSQHRNVEKWKENPKKKEAMFTAIGTLLAEKKEKDDEYAADGDNSAASLFQPRRQAPSADKDASSESEDEADKGKKNKRKNKKDEKSESETEDDKKGKKNTKKKNKKDDNSESESEDDKKDAKKKKKEKDESSASENDEDKKEKKKAKKKKASRKRSSSASSSDSEEKKKQKKEGKKRSRSSSASDKVARAAKMRKEYEAAYTTWAHGDVQAFTAEAETLSQGVGDLKDGTYPTDELVELSNKIPPLVLDTHPVLKNRVKELDGKTEVSNVDAKALALSMVKLGKDIESFYAGQSGKAGGSDGN